MRLLVCLCSALALAASSSAWGDDEAPTGQPSLHRQLDRASDFAPVGVLLDHTHEKGDWTFLYRYQRIAKKDLLIGNQPVTNDVVGARYPSVPLSMVSEYHTMGVMYAPRDRLTFALLLPVVKHGLREQVNGVVQDSETFGIGDAKLLFLLPFIQKGREKTQFNFGISFPTGSIRQTDDNGVRRPYTMQLGSGSWDAIWGITYTGAHNRISWGGQFESRYRIADNVLGYRLGTIYHASSWVAGAFGRWLSASGRISWTRRGNIRGEDLSFQALKAFSPLYDNKLQAGTIVEVGPGINVLLPIFGGQRLSVEALFPIYESLDGPQLATDLTITAGWQWIF